LDGYEIILGSSVDPQFGPVLLFGSGGQLVEVQQDLALALPPLNSTLARRMDSPPWSLDYFRHQRDGAFWHSPVRELESIRIPCFLIAGLQDGYRNSVVRMLEHLRAPVHALIGPWNHDFPNSSMYGPRIEWRDQAVRWFDYWLKGRDTGVLQDPKVVIFQQHWHPPEAQSQDLPGEWRAESWPPKGLDPMTLYLQPDRRLAPQLGQRPSGIATLELPDRHDVPLELEHGSSIWVSQVVGQVFQGDDTRAAQQNNLLHHVSELSHISRPSVGQQAIEGLARQLFRKGICIFLAGLSKEVLNQLREILAALTQRRHADRQHV